MAVQQIQSDDRVISQLQNNIVPPLNKLIAMPLNQGVILKSISLASGANQIPHGLGRALQGWSIVRQRSLASIYDTQDSNTLPSSNLNLVSSAAVTVDIYVF